MFEKRDEPLAPFGVFILRVIFSVVGGFILLSIALCAGMFAYYHFENVGWLSGFLNSALIISGMGPASHMTTDAGKLFESFYVLFCGLIFISVIGVILAPILHRFMHTFHSTDSSNPNTKGV